MCTTKVNLGGINHLQKQPVDVSLHHRCNQPEDDDLGRKQRSMRLFEFVWETAKLKTEENTLCTRIRRKKQAGWSLRWRSQHRDRAKTNKQAEENSQKHREGGALVMTVVVGGGRWAQRLDILDFDVSPIRDGSGCAGSEPSWWQMEHAVSIKRTAEYNSHCLHLRRMVVVETGAHYREQRRLMKQPCDSLVIFLSAFTPRLTATSRSVTA